MEDYEHSPRASRFKKYRYARRKKIRDRFALMVSSGMLTALSVNSLLLSHSTRPTFAMLTDSTQFGFTLGAASHFPEWYQTQINQMEVNLSAINQAFIDMKAEILNLSTTDTKGKAQDILSVLENQAQTIQLDSNAINVQYSEVQSAYENDKRAYQIEQNQFEQDATIVNAIQNSNTKTEYEQFIAQNENRLQRNESISQEFMNAANAITSSVTTNKVTHLLEIAHQLVAHLQEQKTAVESSDHNQSTLATAVNTPQTVIKSVYNSVPTSGTQVSNTLEPLKPTH